MVELLLKMLTNMSKKVVLKPMLKKLKVNKQLHPKELAKHKKPQHVQVVMMNNKCPNFEL